MFPVSAADASILKTGTTPRRMHGVAPDAARNPVAASLSFPPS